MKKFIASKLPVNRKKNCAPNLNKHSKFKA